MNSFLKESPQPKICNFWELLPSLVAIYQANFLNHNLPKVQNLRKGKSLNIPVLVGQDAIWSYIILHTSCR